VQASRKGNEESFVNKFIIPSSQPATLRVLPLLRQAQDDGGEAVSSSAPLEEYPQGNGLRRRRDLNLLPYY